MCATRPAGQICSAGRHEQFRSRRRCMHFRRTHYTKGRRHSGRQWLGIGEVRSLHRVLCVYYYVISCKRLVEQLFSTCYCSGSPSPIMMAGVRTRHWEDEGDPFYREKLFQVFSKIDKDHDGSITRDELRQYCGDEQLDDAIKALDINQDGSISFEEFYACFKKVTPLLNSLTPHPACSTPRNNMATSYEAEADDEDALEWESIMKKFSIDSDSPLFQ